MIPHEIAAFVPWTRVLEEVGVNPGRNNRTCCFIHGGDNPQAFIYNEDSGRAHCFSCGWRGDKLDFFQKALGVDFKTALSRLAATAGVRLDSYRKPDPAELRRAHTHRAALTAARNAYKTWQNQKFNKLVSFKFQELLPEIEAAEIAYRALCRKPELYSFTEQRFWITRLGKLYAELTRVELNLDYLLLREYEAERQQWWRSEDVAVAA